MGGRPAEAGSRHGYSASVRRMSLSDEVAACARAWPQQTSLDAGEAAAARRCRHAARSGSSRTVYRVHSSAAGVKIGPGQPLPDAERAPLPLPLSLCLPLLFFPRREQGHVWCLVLVSSA